MPPFILSVGQCAADDYRLGEWLRRHLQAEFASVDTAEEAFDRVRASAPELILVNRILDRNGGSGLEVIRRLKADPAAASVPVMLVSNFPEAQKEAVAAGAVPGIGKAQLDQAPSLARVEAALAGRSG